MILPIGKDWRIRSDELQFIVEGRKVHKETGVERWKPESFHANLEYAITSLAMRQIRMLPEQGVENVLRAIERIAEEFQSALTDPLEAAIRCVAASEGAKGTPPTCPKKERKGRALTALPKKRRK